MFLKSLEVWWKKINDRALWAGKGSNCSETPAKRLWPVTVYWKRSLLLMTFVLTRRHSSGGKTEMRRSFDCPLLSARLLYHGVVNASLGKKNVRPRDALFQKMCVLSVYLCVKIRTVVRNREHCLNSNYCKEAVDCSTGLSGSGVLVNKLLSNWIRN